MSISYITYNRMYSTSSVHSACISINE